jgi:hypothetical protein
MNEHVFVDFKPKWMRIDSGRTESLADDPTIGLEPQHGPRLNARIVPKSDANSISALTLADTVSITQRIVNYVGCEVVYGVRLDFADLRSIDGAVFNFAKLHVCPFEEGSFVIPSTLTERAVEIAVDGDIRKFYTQDLLARFAEVMSGVNSNPAFPASIGLIQAIEELGKVLRREAHEIEYGAVGYTGALTNAPKKISVNSAYIEKVSNHRRFRQNPHEKPVDLEGILTAVDLSEEKFKLRVLPGRQTLTGSFVPFIKDKMIDFLGSHVRISAIVEYTNDRPVFAKAIDIDLNEFVA